MDIEKLKKKRQLNVQEQNALEEYRILSAATYWRENGIPNGLIKVLNDYNINHDKSIFLNYQQYFPDCYTDEGIVVTEDERFIKFEMDLSADRENLKELYLWNDITNRIEVNSSVRGIGATWGYLALKALSKLNGDESFEYRNLVDINFCSNFMKAYQDVFILIRAKPKAIYNVILLKIFLKYLPSVLEFNDSDARMLKKDLNSNIVIEDWERKALTSQLSKHDSKRRFENFEKIKRFMPILDEITQEMITLLEKQEFLRVNEIADAAHNFPEFLISSTWNIDEFWKIYIVPYKKRWDKDFLDQWESLSELSSLKLEKKMETGFLKRIFKKFQ